MREDHPESRHALKLMVPDCQCVETELVDGLRDLLAVLFGAAAEGTKHARSLFGPAAH